MLITLLCWLTRTVNLRKKVCVKVHQHVPTTVRLWLLYCTASTVCWVKQINVHNTAVNSDVFDCLQTVGLVLLCSCICRFYIVVKYVVYVGTCYIVVWNVTLLHCCVKCVVCIGTCYIVVWNVVCVGTCYIAVSRRSLTLVSSCLLSLQTVINSACSHLTLTVFLQPSLIDSSLLDSHSVILPFSLLHDLQATFTHCSLQCTSTFFVCFSVLTYNWLTVGSYF